MEERKAKRQYQDSVFRLIFADRESAIELFNALEGTDYTSDTDVVFTTLEDALYHGIKNDLGFLIDFNRFAMMSEHQSTINENMPMRQLQYAAKTYERILDREELYRKGHLIIPAPVFYVLYTGEVEWKKESLRLSDSYASVPGENTLELVVKVIDLRYNKDNPILQRSEKLKGYSYLLYCIRENRKSGMDLRLAIDQAVDKCIGENKLKEFLMKHRSEVGSMLYYDISEERFWEIRMQEAEEIGLRNGFEKGMEKGVKAGLEKGIEQGIANSIALCRDLGLTKEQTLEKLNQLYDTTKVALCMDVNWP